MKKNILIIEDESSIADMIIYSLSSEGLNPIWAKTGYEGLDILKKNDISLLIIDIGLPDINGFELLKQIRQFSDIQVLILTARNEEIDKVLGLELGADDYVTKPFSPRELSARIKAHLRRLNSNDTIPFKIDENKKIIVYFSKNLHLSKIEYSILSLLIKKPGWVYSRDKIIEMLWDDNTDIYDRTIDAHIKSIRIKLKEIRNDIDPIITHRGLGYSIKENM